MSRNNKTKYINLAKPLVSILTPTYNRPDWLRLTLRSLIAQTYSNWECLLINDAGVSVQNVVDEFKDSRIKYYENSINLDLAGTRNVATEKSSGDWIITLDDDDGLYPETLEFRLWRAKKLNVEIVYSRALQMFYEKDGSSYKQVGEKIYWDSIYHPDLILIQNVAPCNAIMYSRKAQEKGGLFDVELKTGEDWDHSISMSRYYPFFETKIIDCYCSYRNEPNGQMTGTRNWNIDVPKTFKKWRHTAIDKDWVIQNQNAILKARGLNPGDYGL